MNFRKGIFLKDPWINKREIRKESTQHTQVCLKATSDECNIGSDIPIADSSQVNKPSSNLYHIQRPGLENYLFVSLPCPLYQSPYSNRRGNCKIKR